MTGHLRKTEFVDLLDGALSPARARHLDHCAPCRARADQLRSALDRAAAADGIPEPPPGFWNDLSDRVRGAVAREPAPRANVWGGLRPWPARFAVAASAAAIALAAALWQARVPEPRGDGGVPIAARDAAPEPDALDSAAGTRLDAAADEEWALVLSVAEAAAPEDIHAAGVMLAPGSTERLALTLNDRERIELARLVEEAIKAPPSPRAGSESPL
jgi:hypothetical protein